MAENFDIWKLLAGLGIFLFGMLFLEESVRALSGRTFRRMIRQYTEGRVRSIGSGALVTAILQSSSAVSLMVLAFVGAGVMTMQNAIGVIMGSNIGTTFTAWVVAALGFKMKIESFALPFIGVGGIGLIFFGTGGKLFHVSRLVIGFGFLFLGLDYMKGSVEHLAQTFNVASLPDYGLWFYGMVGTLLSGFMHSSAATIAIVLTALDSGLITFDMGAVMVIGANVGTTITILIGSIGGIQVKKRVAFSHLIFNVVTAAVAFAALPVLVRGISVFFDIESNAVMGLALFHTVFNVLGVVIFFPLIGLLTVLLYKVVPERKTILTVYIERTPTEVIDAAAAALRKEVGHLLQEAQMYNLRLLRIDENLVFDNESPFEKGRKKKLALEEFYERIKLLHAEIFTYYSKLQNHNLDANEAKELERVIYASRNIMNSIKNFKGVRQNMEEFDCSENPYLNAQYKLFRKRLVEIYHGMGRVEHLENKEEQSRSLMKVLLQAEDADKQFIRDTMKAVSTNTIKEMEISSLLLVNRLFSQACRMQIFSIKDLALPQEQINDFDRTLDMKETIDEEEAKLRQESTCMVPQESE